MDSTLERHRRDPHFYRHVREHAACPPAAVRPEKFGHARRRKLTASLALFAAVAGCSDGGTSPSDTPAPPTLAGGANRVAQVLECRVDVAAASLACDSAPPSASLTPAPQLGQGARANVLVGNQNRYVRLASANIAVAGDVFSTNVTVQNLMLQALGTLDGTTLDTAGVRVFFSTAPTNGVEVANPDGTATFTAANQPYFQYSQVLQPAGVSSAKPWQFTLNGATSFTFEVYVSAEVPDQAQLAISLTSVATGYQYACGLDSGGRAYCWGVNSLGQLGDGTTTPRTTPTAVAGGLTFSSLVAGARHACALTASGAAYCWGYNVYGQLGDGTNTDRRVPTAVVGGLTFTTLSASGHTCGIVSTGEAFCWGYNLYGRLGDGTTSNRYTPAAVMGGLTFTAISAGGSDGAPVTEGHTCALTEDGSAYCWGNNVYGQLGTAASGNQSVPTLVSGGSTFLSIKAGLRNSCALTAAGKAYCWGWNSAGQVGDSTQTTRTAPVAVGGGLTFAAIDPGSTSTHTCALTAAGKAYCWGSNGNGRLGDSTTTNRLTPTAVADTITFTAIAAGGSFTCGVASRGIGYCWGSNTGGSLGDGTSTARLTPVSVASTRAGATP